MTLGDQVEQEATRAAWVVVHGQLDRGPETQWESRLQTESWCPEERETESLPRERIGHPLWRSEMQNKRGCQSTRHISEQHHSPVIKGFAKLCMVTSVHACESSTRVLSRKTTGSKPVQAYQQNPASKAKARARGDTQVAR